MYSVALKESTTKMARKELEREIVVNIYNAMDRGIA